MKHIINNAHMQSLYKFTSRDCSCAANQIDTQTETSHNNSGRNIDSQKENKCIAMHSDTETTNILSSFTNGSMSSIAVPGLQLSTVLRLVVAPHLSIGFRISPNITQQTLWNSCNNCVVKLIYHIHIGNMKIDTMIWYIYIYIYLYIYISHRWNDTLKQLTAQPWKSPKKST